MSQKITLYWLNHSRSQRILWLLEELNLQYDLEIFKRDKDMRAPKEFKKIHPLGKSPILKIGDKIIGESGFITQYLINNFDAQGKLKPDTEEDRIDHDYYLHYCEGTLQSLLVSILILNMTRTRLPWLVKPIGNKVVDAILSSYYLPELYLNLQFLENQLQGKQYFVGEKLTGADIMLSFPIFSCFKSDRVTLDKEYPNLQKWVELMDSNPVLQKCNEKAKQYN